jgi:hypothetical protein
MPSPASPVIKPISQATPVTPPPPRTSLRLPMSVFYTNPVHRPGDPALGVPGHGELIHNKERLRAASRLSGRTSAPS